MRERFARRLAACLPRRHVWLETCNRVELYSGDGPCPPAVAHHLLRVASGLESRMIGEGHIQGQVRRAYQRSIDSGYVSPGLHRLFQAALRTGKRVRSETGIALGAVSHSQAALACLTREVSDLPAREVLVIGAHHMGCQIIRLLLAHGCRRVTLANRDADRARDMARELGCQALSLEKALWRLPSVVITATSSATPIIDERHVPAGRALLILDLAAPRDVSAAAADAPNVTVHTLAAIESQVDQNLAARRGELARAEAIVRQEAARLC